MKKLILAIATLTTSIIYGQTSDSTSRVSEFKLTVIMPIEDPSVQNRPKCYTQADASMNGCCVSYNVYCNGNLAWTGNPICDFNCLTFGSIGFSKLTDPNGNNPPTASDPKKTSIKYDFSVVQGLSYTGDPLQGIVEIKKIEKEMMFETTVDQYFTAGGKTLLFKKGFYVIRNGKMDVLYYFQ